MSDKYRQYIKGTTGWLNGFVGVLIDYEFYYDQNRPEINYEMIALNSKGGYKTGQMNSIYFDDSGVEFISHDEAIDLLNRPVEDNE